MEGLRDFSWLIILRKYRRCLQVQSAVINKFMSIKAMHQQKLQISLKKERIYGLEKRYVSSFKANQHLNEYNALQDKYAIHYFVNRPVKKHLKRLAKAINLEPLTTQNQRILSSLNEIIKIHNTQNVSERILRHSTEPSKDAENATTSAVKYIKPSNLNSQAKKKEHMSLNIFDPYTQMMKPASIEKIKLLQLQALQRKKNKIGNKSNESLRMRSGSSETKQSTLVFKGIEKTQRSDELQTKNRKAKNVTRAETENQTKHLKLIDFINKKKNELGSTHLNPKSTNQLSTPALRQDF